MSSLSQFVGGGLVPRGFINGSSTAQGLANYGAQLNSTLGNGGIEQTLCRVTISGSQTAATLATVLSLSGRGAIGFLACGGVDATARTHRFRVTLDGAVIYDATSPSVVSINNWVMPIGCVINTASYSHPVPEYLQFNSSLLIEYASSLSETAKTVFAYRYIPR